MEKLSMLKIKELFRLALVMKLSARQVGKSLNVSHTVVNGYLGRFRESGLAYDDLLAMGDREILSTLSIAHTTSTSSPATA